MRIGETEIMQIVAAALVKIVGEYRLRLASTAAPAGASLQILKMVGRKPCPANSSCGKYYPVRPSPRGFRYREWKGPAFTAVH